MGWVGAHAHAREYLWATAGNMGAVLTEAIEEACLMPLRGIATLPIATADCC